MVNLPMLNKAKEHIAARDNAGKNLISSVNSFSALSDFDILDKALEIGIDVSSLPTQM